MLRASAEGGGSGSAPQAGAPLAGCRIYVHDVAARVGMRLHARYTPCDWPHVQHADEAWISKALWRSPWRVEDPAQADLIYLDGTEFSRWCTASRILSMRNTQQRAARANTSSEVACAAAEQTDTRTAHPAGHVLSRRRRSRGSGASSEPLLKGEADVPLLRDEQSKRLIWQLMLETSAALAHPQEGVASSPADGTLNQLPSSSAATAATAATAAASSTSSSAVMPARRRRVPRVVVLTSFECPPPYRPLSSPAEDDLIVLLDQNPRAYDVVTPYVVSQPPWLAAVPGAQMPPVPSWSSRKLLFFAGHTPKLTQSLTRYLLWKQMRRSPHVTALSSTIGCNVASYEVCESPDAIANDYGSFCHRWCGSKIMCTGGAQPLRRQCETVRRYVNFSDEREDLLAASGQGRLTHAAYLSLARSHRFCLVAPGDFVSTHKITEAMAIGGSGGCIPVFVLPATLRGRPGVSGAVGALPYTSWLDYCAVSFVIDERRARYDAATMVERLLAVTPSEADAKLRELARVRAAFVFHEGSSPSQPTAAEYILDEACKASSALSSVFLLNRCAQHAGQAQHMPRHMATHTHMDQSSRRSPQSRERPWRP